MAASAKTSVLNRPTATEEWTVVLPRRGKRNCNISGRKTPKLQEETQSWIPNDREINPERESKLMQRMQTSIEKLENSDFCRIFLDQIQSPELLDRFLQILGSESNMQMVIYGIGSIELYEPPRLQLSLAILMKRKYNWIGSIEVFDPVISAIEARVFEALGCSVLSINEQGKREALKPTLFFMPHCEAELYDNLLKANWRMDMLSHIALFGNSFEAYEKHVSIFKSPIVVDSRRHILAVRRFTMEFAIDTVTGYYFQALNGSSWHFFSPDLQEELLPIDL